MDEGPPERYRSAFTSTGLSMSAHPDAAVTAVLQRLLAENGLSADSRLYREALKKSLVATGQSGVFLLAANPSPTESVVDIYGQGYIVQAEQTGAGLTFAESAQPNWQETMEQRVLQAGAATRQVLSLERVEVEVRLGDILDQGGLVYPVESVTVERAWYCTLPSGSVPVRVVM
jgi:hypothetical protein